MMIASGSRRPTWRFARANSTVLPSGSTPARRRRPDDGVVWHARLELARAQSDVAGVWHALERLPVDALSPTELLRLRVWLASLTGELEVERAALCSLIEREPGETAALDRLASLAEPWPRHRGSGAAPGEKIRDAGRADCATKALLHGDSIGDPAELARLAEALGRADRSQGLGPDSRRKGGPPGPVAAGTGSPGRCGGFRTSFHGYIARRTLQGPAARTWQRAGHRPAGSRSAIRR